MVGKGWVQRVALSPDGKTLAIFGEATSRAIDLFDAGTGAKLRSLAIPAEQPGVIAIDVSLCFSPDGKTLYLGTGSNLSVLGWDRPTGKALPLIGKHDGGLNKIALSCDGRSLAVVTMDGSLSLWEIATRQVRFVSKEAGYVTTVVYSADGRYLALANTGNHQLLRRKEVIPSGVENREQVRIVRVADGKVVRRFTGHLGGINCLRFSPDGRVLASGGLDTTVLLWDIAGLCKDDVRDSPPHSPPLTPEKRAELWRGLLGQATEAHGCMGTLIAVPDKAVPLLGEKLKPIAAVDAERFAQLLKKLESDQFAEREEATQVLRKLGHAIEPALRKTLQEKLPLEMRRRLQALLDDLDGNQRVRSLRAIEVLERIGDKPARDLLRRLSEGATGAWLTEEARMSLRRLEQRDK